MNKDKLGPHSVIVEKIGQKERLTPGGLIIPETISNSKQKGKVIATGKGTTSYPMEIQEGDILLFDASSAIDVEIDGVEYYLLTSFLEGIYIE